MENDWLSARETMKLAMTVFSSVHDAATTICSRASDGMLRARAKRFVVDDHTRDDVEINKGFWWARGEAALEQNWITGDFETWIDRKHHVRAYGVAFNKEDILCTLGLDALPQKAAAAAVVSKSGRPPAEWWDDLWVEMARQLFTGDLQPKRQADIEAAMKNWISSSGHNVADSTVRSRARKLWRAIYAEDEN
jgi:hypothetical protein